VESKDCRGRNGRGVRTVVKGRRVRLTKRAGCSCSHVVPRLARAKTCSPRPARDRVKMVVGARASSEEDVDFRSTGRGQAPFPSCSATPTTLIPELSEGFRSMMQHERRPGSHDNAT